MVKASESRDAGADETLRSDQVALVEMTIGSVGASDARSRLRWALIYSAGDNFLSRSSDLARRLASDSFPLPIIIASIIHAKVLIKHANGFSNVG